MKLRKEFDSIGSINVPNDKYWGASTQRSNKFFNIGKILVNISIIKSIAIIKRSAAIVHAKDKLIDGKISKAQLEAIKQQVSEKHKRRLPGVDPATGPMVPPLDPDELPQRVRTPEPAPDSPVSMDMMSPELQKRFKNKKMAPPVPIRHRQKIGMDR